LCSTISGRANADLAIGKAFDLARAQSGAQLTRDGGREPGIRCTAEENELARRQRPQGQALWRARVRAALRAAAARPRGPFVCAAFRADAERWAVVRRLDAVLA
jgi:hypothetical protein